LERRAEPWFKRLDGGGLIMAELFWLSDVQLAAIEPHLPRGRPGVKPQRNREVLSGIIHVQRIGCRWRDCPAEYGPPTTVYNRFNRWSKRGIWQALFQALVHFDAAVQQSIDSTAAKAHRCAAGGKGGPKIRRSAAAAAAAPPRSMPSPTALAG
jgi:transposase